jgi:hypothetical protein
VPIPQTENEFNENVVGPTPEVVEQPTQFEYGRSYEQSTSQIVSTEEITSPEYDTWPAGTWVPIPQTENEFNENVVGPTPEVVEQPTQFEYGRSYEQSTSHIVSTEEITSPEYDTCPAGTWVPIPQTENEFNENVVGPRPEVVEQPTQFDYGRNYGCMYYEQPTFQVLMGEEIISYEYGTWRAGTWVPTLHGDSPFCGDSVGKMPTGYIQYSPQLVWMNPSQW